MTNVKHWKSRLIGTADYKYVLQYQREEYPLEVDRLVLFADGTWCGVFMNEEGFQAKFPDKKQDIHISMGTLDKFKEVVGVQLNTHFPENFDDLVAVVTYMLTQDYTGKKLMKKLSTGKLPAKDFILKLVTNYIMD